MPVQSNELNIKGQNIYIGIDVHFCWIRLILNEGSCCMPQENCMNYFKLLVMHKTIICYAPFRGYDR
jgi:hypothetical protein